MQLSQAPKYFSQFFIVFLKSPSNSEYFAKTKKTKQNKKNESHSLSMSEIIDSERGGYLNVKKVLCQNTLRQST